MTWRGGGGGAQYIGGNRVINFGKDSPQMKTSMQISMNVSLQVCEYFNDTANIRLHFWKTPRFFHAGL